MNSIYFVFMTLTTVGYGDVEPINIFERIFTIIIMIFSIFFYSKIISSINFLWTSTVT